MRMVDAITGETLHIGENRLLDGRWIRVDNVEPTNDEARIRVTVGSPSAGRVYGLSLPIQGSVVLVPLLKT